MVFPKGRHRSEKTKRKISKANTGKHHSEETKRKISKANKGKTFSKEHRKKLSKAKMGNIPWNKGKTRADDPRIMQSRLGKHHSEEAKRKISEARKGKPHLHRSHPLSKETKRKISEAKKGENHHFYGKRLSKEHRRKISETNKGKFIGENNPNYGKHLSDEAKAKIREARLKRVFPKKDTSIEVLIQEELRRQRINFEKHVPLLGRYQVDIKIGNLIVECDGRYWHSLPRKVESDHIRDLTLKKAGYKILRLREHEIEASPENCVERIKGVI